MRTALFALLLAGCTCRARIESRPAEAAAVVADAAPDAQPDAEEESLLDIVEEIKRMMDDLMDTVDCVNKALDAKTSDKDTVLATESCLQVKGYRR